MNFKRPSAVTCRCDRFDVRSQPLVTRRASIIVAVPLNRCPLPERHSSVSVGMLRVSSDLRRSSSGFMAYPLSEGQLGFRFPVDDNPVL